MPAKHPIALQQYRPPAIRLLQNTLDLVFNKDLRADWRSPSTPSKPLPEWALKVMRQGP